jgi:hypothetical protein
MTSLLRTTIALLPTVSAFLILCSTFDELAGGSGAGNPGGTVAVTLKAEVSIGMAKATAGEFNKQESDTSSIVPLVVTDKAGLELYISEIIFSCADFRFMLDPSEDATEILQSFNDHSSLLSSDKGSLVLGGGPYLCNGITGEMLPSIDSVRLPVAKYTGIMLRFKDTPDFFPHDTFNKNELFRISGTFFYYGRLCRFIVDINHSFNAPVHFAGGIFTLSDSDTTNIELRFDANKWFKGIDLKKAIVTKDLQFNPNGDIFIGGHCNDSANQKIEFAIQNAFIESGRLVVY